jgi:hypothetical protein
MVANVRWVIDQHGRPARDLDLDGHPARIRSSQKTVLLQRGMVDGMTVFASERAAQLPNIHIHGDVDAAYGGPGWLRQTPAGLCALPGHVRDDPPRYLAGRSSAGDGVRAVGGPAGATGLTPGRAEAVWATPVAHHRALHPSGCDVEPPGRRWLLDQQRHV